MSSVTSWLSRAASCRIRVTKTQRLLVVFFSAVLQRGLGEQGQGPHRSLDFVTDVWRRNHAEPPLLAGFSLTSSTSNATKPSASATTRARTSSGLRTASPKDGSRRSSCSAASGPSRRTARGQFQEARTGAAFPRQRCPSGGRLHCPGRRHRCGPQRPRRWELCASDRERQSFRWGSRGERLRTTVAERNDFRFWRLNWRVPAKAAKDKGGEKSQRQP